MTQPALVPIGDETGWRDGFTCAALADVEGNDNMRAVVTMQPAG